MSSFLRHPKYYNKNFTSFLPSIRTSEKNIKFDDKKISKKKSYKNKKIFDNTDKTDVDKILITKNESYGTNKSFKYLIGYNDDDKIKPLCIKLPQMSDYVQILYKYFTANKTMSFKVINNSLLKR